MYFGEVWKSAACGLAPETPRISYPAIIGLAVVPTGGINWYGRRSSYSINMRVSVGGQVLSSGAPFCHHPE